MGVNNNGQKIQRIQKRDKKYIEYRKGTKIQRIQKRDPKKRIVNNKVIKYK